MDPRFVEPEQWDQIARLLLFLLTFVGLSLNAALAWLLGRAIIPSLVATGDADGAVRVFRLLLTPLAVVSFALALVVGARGGALAADLLRTLYPRFLV